MVVFIVKNGNETVTETVSFLNAMDVYRNVNKKYGMNSASIWKYNTNDSTQLYSRVNVDIHDNSIKTN